MSAQSGYVTVKELGIYYICLHRADMSGQDVLEVNLAMF